MSKSFLQSEKWARFQESVERKIFWIENKLVIKFDLLLGLSYLYSPRPNFASEETFKKFLHEARKLAKKENSIFFRLEPDINSKIQDTRYKQLSNNKIQTSKNRQPQDTLILDLSQSEETLLVNMHQKTRYNIRLAEKHGIKMKNSTNPDDVDIFYNLAIKTAKRDGFNYHSRTYYKKMMQMLGKDDIAKLYIAYQDKIPLAAIIVLQYEDTVIYLHGASDHQYRNLMASYLLQWSAIKDAKKNGCKFYDLWGVAPSATEILNPKSEILNKSQIPNPKSNDQDNLKFENLKLKINEPHPWEGITRFKLGFNPNGQIIHYPDCLDLIYQPIWYKIYKLARKIL